MGVQVFGNQAGANGHEKTMSQFRSSNTTNGNGLLNHFEGKDVDAVRPPYDPKSPDNQWPLMVHHPAKGELTVGKTTLGAPNENAKREIVKQNLADLDAAFKAGYRKEYYVKPQIAVLSPEVEKAESLKREMELRGQNVALQDQLNKLQAAFEASQKTA